MSYKPIEDSGIVDDLHTVALVSTEGSIDFMCFSRFDSPTICVLAARMSSADQQAIFRLAGSHRPSKIAQLQVLGPLTPSRRGVWQGKSFRGGSGSARAAVSRPPV